MTDDYKKLEDFIKKDCDAIKEKLSKIYEQREEILIAFVAKYGFDADEAVQIESRTSDGGFEWHIERNGELANLRKFKKVTLQLIKEVWDKGRNRYSMDKFWDGYRNAVEEILSRIKYGVDLEDE